MSEFLWVPVLWVNFQLSRHNFGNIMEWKHAKLYVVYRNISVQLCLSTHISINWHAEWNVPKVRWVYIAYPSGKSL